MLLWLAGSWFLVAGGHLEVGSATVPTSDGSHGGLPYCTLRGAFQVAVTRSVLRGVNQTRSYLKKVFWPNPPEAGKNPFFEMSSNPKSCVHFFIPLQLLSTALIFTSYQRLVLGE